MGTTAMTSRCRLSSDITRPRSTTECDAVQDWSSNPGFEPVLTVARAPRRASPNRGWPDHRAQQEDHRLRHATFYTPGVEHSPQHNCQAT